MPVLSDQSIDRRKRRSGLTQTSFAAVKKRSTRCKGLSDVKLTRNSKLANTMDFSLGHCDNDVKFVAVVFVYCAILPCTWQLIGLRESVASDS